MMHWFRSHHGAPYDSKLAVVSKRANVTRGHAASVWWAALDHASQQTPRGDVSKIDPEEIAAAYDYDEADVAKVLAAMRHKELLIDKNNMLTGWNKRQVSREDETAIERKRAQRSRETEAKSRNVTLASRNDTVDKTRLDTDKKEELASEFEEFWLAYPKRSPEANPKQPAKVKFLAAVKSGAKPEAIIAAAHIFTRRAKADGTEPKFIPMATTWLNQRRWEDPQKPPPDEREANFQHPVTHSW